MADNGPMNMLCELAAQTLSNTTRHLGKGQQTWHKAATQLEELQNFEREYQEQLQGNIAGKGMSIAMLIAHQSFIESLGRAVTQHAEHVDACQRSVDQIKQVWRQDKRRLNSYETLQDRARAVLQQKENRREQKMMDEFAQRASMKSGVGVR